MSFASRITDLRPRRSSCSLSSDCLLPCHLMITCHVARKMGRKYYLIRSCSLLCLILIGGYFVEDYIEFYYADWNDLFHLKENIRVAVQNQSHPCWEVHLALQCDTENARRELPVFLKSVLYHSKTSIIHLHLVTDNFGLHILQRLFETWQLPMVYVHFYPTQGNAESSVLSTALVVLSHCNSTNLLNMKEIFISRPDAVFITDVATLPSLTAAVVPEKKMAFISSDKNKTPEALLYINTGEISLAEVKTFQRSPSVAIPVVDIPKVFMISSMMSSELALHMTELDGDMFRSVYHPCVVEIKVVPESYQKLPCYEFTLHAFAKRRTQLYFYTTSPMDENTASVSLVTTLQLNRLEGLLRLLSVWDGPVHVSLYLADSELPQFLNFLHESHAIRRKASVAFHIIYKRLEKYYPINHLRNIALKEVKTKYVLMLDVDFVPCPNLAHDVVAIKEKYFSNKDVALIVPAFETSLSNYAVPGSKSVFVQHLKDNLVSAYHQKVGWPAGHKYTNFDKWLEADAPYKVEFGYGFEPYVVVETSKAPLYTEALLERMRDKIPYAVALETAGTELFVLPNVYTVHLPHPKSLIYKYSGARYFGRCNAIIYFAEIDRIKENKDRTSHNLAAGNSRLLR